MAPTNRGNIGKFEGVILGAATGDALGWPHEDRARRSSLSEERGSYFERWIKRSGGRFQPHEERIDAGSYSDDTQLIIAVARSRLRGDDWCEYLARVEFPFWTAYHRGAGGASLRAARSLLKGVLPWEGSSIDRRKYFEAGGNGVAMRIAPHCLVGSFDKDFSEVARNVVADGVLTHGHPTALVGALAYAYALWLALRTTGTLEYGQLLDEVRSSFNIWSNAPTLREIWPTWEEATQTKSYKVSWTKSVDDVRGQLEIASEGLVTGALDFDDEVMQRIGCFDRKISGAGTVSATAAIFLASKYAVSPMEGMMRAALAKGADTDTIASMTGAISGAINGVQWLLPIAKKIQDQQFLTELAHKLYRRLEGEVFASSFATSDASSLIPALNKGEKYLRLPIGSQANVVGDAGVSSKSEKLAANSWKLEDESGQTFFIKLLRKVSSSEARSGQKNFDLNLPVGINGNFAGISLFARDLGESTRFYSRLLGLVITRNTGGLIGLGDHLVLRQNSEVRSVGEGSIVYIDVDDIHTCWENLRGVPYARVSPIRKSARSSFTCQDPDGRTVEVFQREPRT